MFLKLDPLAVGVNGQWPEYNHQGYCPLTSCNSDAECLTHINPFFTHSRL